jgi:SPX domain protein involved in polyphosphate accumulation
VNNVYFDTYAYGAYEENLIGIGRRQKVRLRWYGEIHDRVAGTLEVKCRRGGLGWKLSYPAQSISLTGARWSEVRRELRTQLPPAGRIWLDSNPLPILANSYNRMYFLSADKHIRVTVDWQQRVFDQRFSSIPNLCRPAQDLDRLVVEFKFSAQGRRRASDIIQGLPIRVSRNSKYVMGVQAVSAI